MKFPIHSAANNTRSVVLVKDPQREFKDKISSLNVPTLAKVIGYSKMKTSYPSFSDKRKLANEFDLFFCDYKIYSNLKKGLGKAFYEKKKYPFPIDCQEVPDFLASKFKTYESYINSLNNYTYFIAGNGPAL